METLLVVGSVVGGIALPVAIVLVVKRIQRCVETRQLRRHRMRIDQRVEELKARRPGHHTVSRYYGTPGEMAEVQQTFAATVRD